MKKTLLALVALLSLSFNTWAAVNINTATQAELETLEGVGPVKAQAIIDYRKKNGGFKSIDELEKVDGIGEVTMANVRKDVTLSGKTTVTTPAASNAKKPESTSKEKLTKEEKATKTSKETTVGNSKAAESGKTAATKEVKETKEKKVKAEKETKTEKETSSKKEKTDKEDNPKKSSKAKDDASDKAGKKSTKEKSEKDSKK